MGVTPSPMQIAFMSFWGEDAFLGGAGGPGKSIGILLAALQGVEDQHYHALIVRKTFPALQQAGGLMKIAERWLTGTGARWDGQEKTWTFPSGATLTFGHYEDAAAHERYTGAEYNFVGLDEASQFTEEEQLFFWSRIRGSSACKIPPRFRRASNPGGPGHVYLKRYFVERYEAAQRGEAVPDTVKNFGEYGEVVLRWGRDIAFFPGRLKDNPDPQFVATYVRSIAHLPPVLQQRILDGDWNVVEGGMYFEREWFEVVDQLPATAREFACSYWDLAASAKPSGRSRRRGPDYTVGLLLVEDDARPGMFYIASVDRGQRKPAANEIAIPSAVRIHASMTAGRELLVRQEEEPGSAGPTVIARYRELLRGYDYDGVRKTKDTVSLCGPVASAAKAGNIKILKGLWNKVFLDEAETFGPDCPHDDQIVCLIGAHHALTAGTGGVYDWYRHEAKRLEGEESPQRAGPAADARRDLPPPATTERDRRGAPPPDRDEDDALEEGDDSTDW